MRQDLGEALVIDDSKHLTRLVEFDATGRRAIVEPARARHLNSGCDTLGLVTGRCVESRRHPRRDDRENSSARSLA